MKQQLQKAFITFILLMISFSTQANQVIVISPVPAPRNAILVPDGYTKCYLVRAGRYHGRFEPTHETCRYHHYLHIYHRNVWVLGHWHCNSISPYTGQCYSRYWVPRHWYR